MRGTVGETLERLILLQIGAAAATRDKVQEIVDSLIEQGRVEREEGRTVDHIRELVAQALVGDAEAKQMLRESGRQVGELLAVAQQTWIAVDVDQVGRR